MSFGWGDYVPVAERRRKAELKVAKLKKQGQVIEPVTIEGRKITSTVWGKAWCENLEHYSDFASRLPKGRTYVRNGSVVDLKIGKGVITAMIAGSSLYTARIAVSPLASSRWKTICRDCAGTIDSLVELLQGRVARGVMDRMCRADDGLFPAPDEIELSCSCPDWASMCKHVAAVLYGVGARLDAKPELLFTLRGVDPKDMVTAASNGALLSSATAPPASMLAEDDLSALFGLDLEQAPAEEPAKISKSPPSKAVVSKHRLVRRRVTAVPPPASGLAKPPAGKKPALRAGAASPPASMPTWTPDDIVPNMPVRKTTPTTRSKPVATKRSLGTRAV